LAGFFGVCNWYKYFDQKQRFFDTNRGLRDSWYYVLSFGGWLSLFFV
jgi:hypothetical protein